MADEVKKKDLGKQVSDLQKETDKMNRELDRTDRILKRFGVIVTDPKEKTKEEKEKSQ